MNTLLLCSLNLHSHVDAAVALVHCTLYKHAVKEAGDFIRFPPGWNGDARVFSFEYRLPCGRTEAKITPMGRTLMVHLCSEEDDDHVASTKIKLAQVIEESADLSDLENAFVDGAGAYVAERIQIAVERLVAANTADPAASASSATGSGGGRGGGGGGRGGAHQPTRGCDDGGGSAPPRNPLLIERSDPRRAGPPFGVGDADRLPPVPGFGPARGGVEPGMLIGPRHPGFGSDPYGPDSEFLPQPLPPGVPPGARFDPFGPPGARSGEPNPDHLRKPGFGDDMYM